MQRLKRLFRKTVRKDNEMSMTRIESFKNNSYMMLDDEVKEHKTETDVKYITIRSELEKNYTYYKEQFDKNNIDRVALIGLMIHSYYIDVKPHESFAYAEFGSKLGYKECLFSLGYYYHTGYECIRNLETAEKYYLESLKTTDVFQCDNFAEDVHYRLIELYIEKGNCVDKVNYHHKTLLNNRQISPSIIVKLNQLLTLV